MKKIIILCLAFAVVFTACSVVETGNTGNETIKDTNNISEITPQLNWDLLSNIGLTFKQIQEKDSNFVTKNQINQYENLESLKNLIVESKSESYMFNIINEKQSYEDTVCTDIKYTPAKNIFLGLKEDLSISDIERIYDVRLLSSVWSDIDNIYQSTLVYGNYGIVVRLNAPDIFGPDSEIVGVYDNSYSNIYRNVYNITAEELNASNFQFYIGENMVSIPKNIMVSEFFNDPVIKKIIEYNKSYGKELIIQKNGIEIKDGNVESGMYLVNDEYNVLKIIS